MLEGSPCTRNPNEEGKRMDFTRTALLASIDHALAQAKAALLAGDDAMGAEAASMIARLPAEPGDGWEGIPLETFAAVRSAREALDGGDLATAEQRLEAARATLGGPSS